MQIEHVKINFERKSATAGFTYILFEPAGTDDLSEVEKRFKVSIPDAVKIFYTHYNGLEVHDPNLSVFPIQEWAPQANNLIHFATVNDEHHLCFDTSNVNQANQWTILNCETGYLLTYTMASFWTNKIWNWIVKQRTIWKEENYQ